MPWNKFKQGDEGFLLFNLQQIKKTHKKWKYLQVHGLVELTLSKCAWC